MGVAPVSKAFGVWPGAWMRRPKENPAIKRSLVSFMEVVETGYKRPASLYKQVSFELDQFPGSQACGLTRLTAFSGAGLIASGKSAGAGSAIMLDSREQNNAD